MKPKVENGEVEKNECDPYSEHNFEGSESYQKCTKCDASRTRAVSSISQNSNSAIENGEVIEAFENDESLWIEVENDPSIGDSGFRSELSFDRVKAFITNALNQQKELLIKNVNDEIDKFEDFDWDEEVKPSFELARKLKEFLTKLEK